MLYDYLKCTMFTALLLLFANVRLIAQNDIGQWVYVNDATTCAPIGTFGSCPQGRHEASYVQVGDKFVLIGGRENNSNANIYDPSTNSWTIGKNAPFPIHHFQAISYHGLLLAVGAMTGFFPKEPGIDRIMIYDPMTNNWYDGPTIPADRVRGGAGCVLYKGDVYVISGNTTGHSAPGWVTWLDRYDPETNTWTKLADAPRARDHFHAAIIEDKLYAVGGRQSGASGVFLGTLAEVDVYDFASDTWSTLPYDIPTQRAGNTVAVIGNELIVIGGEREHGPAKNETEALNVNTGLWRELDTLNQGRHGSQAIVNNDNIWIVAGSPKRGGGKVQTHERFYFGSPVAPTLNPIQRSELSGPTDVAVEGPLEVMFQNTGGNQTILIQDVSTFGDGDFQVTPGVSFPYLLKPGASMILNVQPGGTSNQSDVKIMIEHTGTNSPTSVTLSAVSDSFDVIGEVGQTSANHTWKTVSLSNSYQDPVVIAGAMTFFGGSPATVRVREVTASSFQVRVDEWECLDELHAVEDIPYLVVESGSYTLPNGLKIQAGVLSDLTNQWKTANFPDAFDQEPVVFAQCVTENEAEAVITRIDESNTDTEKITLKLKEQDQAVGGHLPETVGWLALEPGSDHGSFEVGKTANVVTHESFTLIFEEAYGQSPIFIGGVGSEYGGDAVSLRVTGLNPQSVSFFLQEETCGDAEVLHGLAEEIHYWVFNEPGSIQGRLSENAKKPVADVRLFSDDAEIPSGLFPNPVSIGEDIFLDLGSSDASYITLINSSGVVMNKQKLSKEKDRLNLNTSSLSKGLYYLVVYSGRSERQHKVLIQ